MAQEPNFKFVSVEDDDDEIVIQAGAAPHAPGAQEPVGRDSGSVPDDASLDGGAESGVSGDDAAGNGRAGAGGVAAGSDEGAAGPDAVEETPEEAAERARFERAKARREREAEANRMITTEDDLKASVPFAGMQRTIVIIAVLLIVAFVVYYKLSGGA